MNTNTTLIQSFKYAFEGIFFSIRHNRNLRIHLAAAVVVVVASVYFKVTPFEMGILGVMIVLVICTEMINSALEEMVDLIISEHRKEAKIAKDVGAGMVLVASMGAVIVGLLIFIPHIMKLIR
ncbi:MAG: diacylglycerol kinase family protein [Candidatus Levybacteria bacterium]|nr:diacylglycerol kinase family protein [Candidatus Levybacteria bacterium]